MRENHAPRRRRHATEELTVDEVANAPEGIAQGDRGHEDVRPLENIDALTLGAGGPPVMRPDVEEHRYNGTDQAAVVIHTLQPHEIHIRVEGPEDEPRSRHVVARRIEKKRGKYPGTNQQTQNRPKEHIEDDVIIDLHLATANFVAKEQIRDGKGYQVHEPVPAKRKTRNDLRRHPIRKAEVGEHVHSSKKLALR